MSSLRPLHRQAAQHFDERNKRKQSESFLSQPEHFDERNKRKQSESFLNQPEHTIFVSRHRTLRTQYLHLGVFL